jgi:hypothetical protein
MNIGKIKLVENLRGPFAKFADWRQCAAVMQTEAVTVVVRVVVETSGCILVLITFLGLDATY